MLIANITKNSLLFKFYELIILNQYLLPVQDI